MRRSGLALLLLALAGCTALQDAFSAHPAVAATAAGQTLSVEQLADWVGRAKKVPVRADALMGVAQIYVDYMLAGAALAQGKRLDDSLFVLQTNWPTVSQLKWEHFHERLVAARAHLASAQVDSAYRAGTVRLFQHILLQLPPSAAPPEEQKKRAELEKVQRQLAKDGANFGQLAKRYSQDPGSKASGGYLNAAGRGALVPSFETAAWQLEPGGMTGVIRSPFGLHLIRRPPLAEVRESYRGGLESAITAHLDSIYVDSVAERRALKIDEGAPALVRQAMQDLDAAGRDGRTLVAYRGGAFRMKDLARWIHALDQGDVRGIANASDSQLRQFLKVVAQRELLIRQADSAGVDLTPDDWRQIRSDHDSALATLRKVLGLSPEVLKDSAATPDARLRLAAAHVNGYLERVLQGSAPFYPVPPFLGEALKQEIPWSINAGGVGRALDRAQTMRAADSARGVPPLRPAPGPPPVPVDTTKRRVLR